MIPWLLFSLLPVPTFANIAKTYGVAPTLAPRYSPLSSDSWKCLDGSKEIPWLSVNDDYCDCPDGSDEPGLDTINAR
jgi:protein kinase C substrate 80K-H